MNKQIYIKPNQTIWDIALQEYGSVDFVYSILRANPTLAIDSEITPGQKLIIPQIQLLVKDKKIVDHYKFIGRYPASGFIVNSANLDLADTTAVNFINKIEGVTGLLVEQNQKTAILGLCKMLFGIGTSNSSDLLTKMINSSTVLYPLCPISDSVAKQTGYEVDLISGTTLGNYIGFSPVDITPSGVIGGSGKYFDCGKSTSDYPIDDMLSLVYSNDPNDYPNPDFGAYGNSGALAESFYMYILYLDLNRVRFNTSSTVFTPLIDAQGLFMLMRNQDLLSVIKNDIIINSVVSSPINFSNNNVYFHGLNSGASSLSSPRQLSMYGVGVPSLSPTEITDLNEAINWYQSNIIVGGRL